MKFVCPKMKWEYDKLTKKSKRVCHCEDPCTESSCGRMFLSLSRKNCVLIQEHCVVHRNGTLHADLLLAGIAQLVTVMVADKIHKHQYIHSLKPLIA